MLKKIHLSFFSLGLLLCCGLGHTEETTAVIETGSRLTLDGKATKVYFNDGDTFKILDGKHQGKRVRVAGYNSLETNPIHEWLDSSVEYLYDNAIAAKKMAQDGRWNCKLEKGVDSYGRLLASCDDLALSLIGAGLAHAYSVDANPAKSKYLKKQRSAQRNNVGMWANGIPDYIITSLHSAAEGEKRPYNRLISTKNGATTKYFHEDSYATCEKVCVEEGNSCMIYVPYSERYGSNRSECLFL